MESSIRLPRPLAVGKRLPCDLVQADQHQRPTPAIAESCVAGGFATVTVDDVVGLTAVSKRTFYRLFDGKQDCLLAAHNGVCLAASQSTRDADQPQTRRFPRRPRRPPGTIERSPLAAEASKAPGATGL